MCGESRCQGVVRVRWVRRAWSRRNLSCVGRGRDVSDNIRLSTAAAREGVRPGGQPPDDKEPVGPARSGGEGEGPWRPASNRQQQGLPRNVESVLKVKLHDHIVKQQERCARSAWLTHWLPAGALTPSCRGAGADRHGAEAGEAEPHLTYNDRPHAPAPGVSHGR
jgi:hypothetical protein